MSSKFFTWTKGDRKVAEATMRSSTDEPHPVEHITLDGVDYFRAIQNPRKSQKSQLNVPVPQPYASDSIALHDATVTSATSLLTVMNDFLRSPHLSAHLSAQQGPSATYGRMRSQTAPPTPQFELTRTEIYELPGSADSNAALKLDKTPQPKQSFQRIESLSSHSSFMPLTEPRKETSTEDLQKLAQLGHSRPTAGAWGSEQHNLGIPPHISYCDSPNQLPDVHDMSNVSGMPQNPRIESECAPMNALRSQSYSEPFDNSTPRRLSVSMSGSNPSSYDSHMMKGTENLEAMPALSSVDYAKYNGSAVTLLDHIASLRKSQEEHIASLRQAHRKEIDMYRSCIASLEKRQALLADAGISVSKHNLTIDTSQLGDISTDTPNLNTSATTLQSSDSLLEGQKKASQEIMAENEVLRRDLLEAHKNASEADRLRRERDELQILRDRNDRRIFQLRDIVKKSKLSEKVLRNTSRDLEARLENANMERVDALQGLYDARERIDRLGKHSSILKLDEVLVHNSTSDPNDSTRVDKSKSTTLVSPKSTHQRAISDSGGAAPASNLDKDVRSLLAVRDTRIQELELSLSTESTRVSELQNAVVEHKASYEKMRSDCERYNVLLHNELRRQNRKAVQKVNEAPESIKAQVSATIAKKMTTPTKSDENGDTQRSGRAEAIALLERELEHCVSEIILYKLDIKKYQKDLRVAEARMKTLETARRPPTPDTETQSNDGIPSMVDKPALRSEEAELEPSSGLGISLPAVTNQARSASVPPTTTNTAVASSTTTSLPVNPPRASQSLSPRSVNRAGVIDKDKELPQPPGFRTPVRTPVATPSPPPGARSLRGDGLRSLSESIVPSYMKRRRPTTPSPGSTALSSNSASPGKIAPTRTERLGSMPSVGTPLSFRSSPGTRMTTEQYQSVQTPPPRVG